MKKLVWLASLLSVLMAFAVFPVHAQQAYGLSSVTYDPSTNVVDSISETELDYTASAYYDPYVEDISMTKLIRARRSPAAIRLLNNGMAVILPRLTDRA
jgi:hypothetical protein